jgi:hypothetical protein
MNGGLMIILNTLSITDFYFTSNWNKLALKAVNDVGGMIIVATIDYATGAVRKYPNASYEKKYKSVSKLKDYLISNNIDTTKKVTL